MAVGVQGAALRPERQVLAPLLQCRAFSCLGAGGNLRAALVVTLIVVSRPGRGLWHPGVLLLTRVSHSLEGFGYEPCGIYLLFVGFFFPRKMSKDSLEVKSPSPPGFSCRLQKEGCGGELQGVLPG